jgi:hypothetical protein
MSRVVVGRIFWKEVRTQRSLWFGALGLAVAAQVVCTLLAINHKRWNADVEQFLAGAYLASYLGVAIYAIATGAASFTEEKEGRTKSLLRVIPMSPAEAFAGKCAYGLASTGLLLLVLFAGGVVCTTITWNELQPDGEFARTIASNPILHAMQAPEVASFVWIGLVIPIVAFGISVFYSLLFSDGVQAALGGLFSTVLALIAAGLVSAGSPSSSFAASISAIALATAIADFRLTGRWLRSDSIVQGRRRIGRGSRGEQIWLWLTERCFESLSVLRLRDPVVPWRRAARRLVWKECIQAWAYAKVLLLLAVLTTVLVTLWPQSLAAAGPWLVALASPLVFGVGAYHADQKDGAFRLLGHHGVSADGAWIIKHLVWILYAVAACIFMLLIYEIGWLLRPHFGLLFPQDIAETVYRFIHRQPFHPRVLTGSLLSESVAIALLYLALGYSIGQRISVSYSKGTMAFGLTAGLTLTACFAWSTM